MADVLEKEVTYVTANVTLTTTTETVIGSCGPVRVPHPTARVRVRGRALLTTGTGATAVTARIRAGTTASGTLVSEQNAQTVKAAAGSNEPFAAEAVQSVSGVDSVTYSLTLEQTGASGNGTALEACLEVEVLNG